MKNSRLFYFPASHTEHGTLPSFYDAVPECFVADAIAAGGRDVSDDTGAWADYDREQAYMNECTS